jgi:hypothetical protein
VIRLKVLAAVKSGRWAALSLQAGDACDGMIDDPDFFFAQHFNQQQANFVKVVC